MSQPVIGIGAGGHAKVMIEIVRLSERYEVMGLLDTTPALQGTTVLGVPVLGNDELLDGLRKSGVAHAFVGLGSVGSADARQRLYELARRTGFDLIDAIHPASSVSASAVTGDGIAIMAGVVINSSAWLGHNVIINTSAVVEHDCRIGNHVHLATGCRLAGGVTVGDGAHIGAGATIRQGVTIGRRAIVGMGSVVVRDVPDRVVVVGSPARYLRDVTP